ncbi:MAG: DUF3137 domain-containing protein [Candidatus Avigastranaerophilus sp.]
MTIYKRHYFNNNKNSRRINKTQKNSFYLKPYLSHYDSNKYKNKYPEFFSDEFTKFCETQVISLYKSVKERIMLGSGNLNAKIASVYMTLVLGILALVTLIPVLGVIIDMGIQAFFPYMPPLLQYLFSNEVILILIFLGILLFFAGLCFTKRLLKMKKQDKYQKIILLNSFLILFFLIFSFIALSAKTNIEAMSFSSILSFLFIIPFSILFVVKIGQQANKLKKEYKAKTMQIKKVVFPVLLSKIAKCAYLTPDDKNYDMRPYLEKLSIIKKCYGKIYEPNDDHFRLVYNDIKVDISEVVFPGSNLYVAGLKKEEAISLQSGGNCLFMRVKSNKPITYKTLITRENSNLAQSTKEHIFKKVQMEDPDFNRAFSVESTDQVEARYLLTPTFMERLKEFAKDYPNNELNVSFEHGFVNIILSKGFYDLFDIESFEQRALSLNDNDVEKMISDNETNISIYRDILIELKEFLTVIDALKLDSTIGL